MLTGRLGGGDARLGNTELGAAGLSGGNARLTQAVAEPVLLPSTQAARLTQLAAEGVLLPSGEAARLTQVAVEVVARVFPASPRTSIVAAG